MWKLRDGAAIRAWEKELEVKLEVNKERETAEIRIGTRQKEADIDEQNHTKRLRMEVAISKVKPAQPTTPMILDARSHIHVST